MNNLDGKENCQAFVEMLGLAILFPLFMKPTITGKKKSKDAVNNEGIINHENASIKALFNEN
jgi:hypothetical protein